MCGLLVLISLDFPIFPFLFYFFHQWKKTERNTIEMESKLTFRKKTEVKNALIPKVRIYSVHLVRSRNTSYVSSGRGRGPQHSRNSRTRQCDVISNPIQIVESTHERSESTYRCTLFGNRGYGTLFFSFTNHLLIHHRSSSLPHRREEFGTLNVKFFIHRVQIFNT